METTIVFLFGLFYITCILAGAWAGHKELLRRRKRVVYRISASTSRMYLAFLNASTAAEECSEALRKFGMSLKSLSKVER